jgi:hypothetical protein
MSDLVSKNPSVKKGPKKTEDEISRFILQCQYNQILKNLQEMYSENNKSYLSSIKSIEYLYKKGIFKDETFFKKMIKDFTTVYIADEIVSSFNKSFYKILMK